MPSWHDDLTEEEWASTGRASLWIAALLTVAAVILILLSLAIGVTAAQADVAQEPPVALEQPGYRYQGKTARWWARRAVQARKDANARGRTIRRLQAAQRRDAAHFFAWLRGAECVHSKEGAWDDPHPPYWGGMQADMDFQRAYGRPYLERWGTADRWPVWAQLHMAYNGWLVRGWQPWPNTSRLCGLR